MAAQTGINLKDIIDAQRKLAEQGDESAKKQITRLEQLQSTFEKSSEAQVDQLKTIEVAVQQPKVAEAVERLQDDIQKTSQSNVKQLLGELVKSTSGAMISYARHAGVSETKREQDYTPGIDAAIKSAGKMTSLESWIDMSSGKNTSGLGGLLRRQVEKKQEARRVQEEKANFIKDQIATGATSNKDLAGRRYDAIVKQQDILGNANREIEGMRERGLTQEQIARTPAYAAASKANRSTAAIDPLYRETVMGTAGGRSSRATPVDAPSPIAAASDAAVLSEQQDESLRIVSAQTELLQKIEENTRGTGASSDRAKAQEASQPTGAAPEESGSILDSVGGLGKGAWKKGKRAITKLKPFALPALAAYAAANVADYGMGKLGIGKDAEGNDKEVDSVADDANWNKMKWYQKAESGLARGIEYAGDTVGLGNLSREAKISRIKSESEYFAKAENKAPIGRESSGMVVKLASGAAPISGMQLQPALSTAGDQLYQTSSQVQDMSRAGGVASSAPVVINAPQNTSINNNSSTTSKSPTRNTDPAFKDYVRSRYAY